MPVFFNGELINVGSNKFTSKEDGKEVSYFINTIKNDSGELITINSQRDYSDKMGKPSTIKITLRPDVQHPKLYKASLSAIEPLPVEQGHDRTIE